MRKTDWLIALVVVGLVGLAAVILAGTGSKPAVESCSQKGTPHKVVISDDKMSPREVTAKRCDTLTIVNSDDITREIGFGDHDHHVAYDGTAQKILRHNESVTITLVKTGHYHFHDHFHDEVEGEFSVD